MSVQEDDWIDLLGLEDTEGGDLLDLLEGEGDFEVKCQQDALHFRFPSHPCAEWVF